MGSVILLEEDLSGNYSRLMLKYFLSEGILHKHPLLVTNSSPGQSSFTFIFSIFVFLGQNKEQIIKIKIHLLRPYPQLRSAPENTTEKIMI